MYQRNLAKPGEIRKPFLRDVEFIGMPGASSAVVFRSNKNNGEAQSASSRNIGAWFAIVPSWKVRKYKSTPQTKL